MVSCQTWCGRWAWAVDEEEGGRRRTTCAIVGHSCTGTHLLSSMSRAPLAPDSALLFERLTAFIAQRWRHRGCRIRCTVSVMTRYTRIAVEQRHIARRVPASWIAAFLPHCFFQHCVLAFSRTLFSLPKHLYPPLHRNCARVGGRGVAARRGAAAACHVDMYLSRDVTARSNGDGRCRADMVRTWLVRRTIGRAA